MEVPPCQPQPEGLSSGDQIKECQHTPEQCTRPVLFQRSLEDRAGFSLIELLLVMALIGIIIAITVPGLMRARLAANEGSATASLRTIGNSGVVDPV